jgi:hypothetical protein
MYMPKQNVRRVALSQLLRVDQTSRRDGLLNAGCKPCLLLIVLGMALNAGPAAAEAPAKSPVDAGTAPGIPITARSPENGSGALAGKEPTGRTAAGKRFAYVNTDHHPAGMIELIEAGLKPYDGRDQFLRA